MPSVSIHSIAYLYSDSRLGIDPGGVPRAGLGMPGFAVLTARPQMRRLGFVHRSVARPGADSANASASRHCNRRPVNAAISAAPWYGWAAIVSRLHHSGPLHCVVHQANRLRQLRSRLGFAEELRAARRRWHPPAAFIAWPHCRHVGFDQACVARHCAGWTTAFTVRCVSVCLKVLHARACVSSSMAVQSRPRSRCLGRSPVHGRAGWAEVVARSSGRVRYRVRSWRDRVRGPGLRHGPGSWPSRG